MALVPPDGGNLVDFLRASQAAARNLTDQEDLCDNLYKSFSNNIHPCKYFDANFKIDICDKNKDLMLLHWNVRSLHKNFDLLHEFIASLDITPHVICVL